VELACRVLHPLKSLAQNPGNVHCHPKKIPLTKRRIHMVIIFILRLSGNLKKGLLKVRYDR